MEKIIQVEDRYYILAAAAKENERTRVLKHGESFAVFNSYGDFQSLGMGEQGFYHGGTRFLSKLRMQLGTERPLLLSSTVKEDNVLLAVDMMNPDLVQNGSVQVPRGLVHIFRGVFLWEGACYQRIRFFNYGSEPIDLDVQFDVDCDFADLFEVRGTTREARGERLPPEYEGGELTLAYQGRDDVRRSTRLSFTPEPDTYAELTAHYSLRLEPGTPQLIRIKAGSSVGEKSTRLLPYDGAHDLAYHALQNLRNESCTIYTSNEQFNEWMNRSLDDVLMMLTKTDYGWYPYAGVPWYNTAFGRDGLITALQSLWINPGIARGVLDFLAANQADGYDEDQDAEPGKILHETRGGEMAELGEIPFKKYYGTVDATPLFVILAGAYFRHTGDLAFLEKLWPHIERALSWIDEDGDLDGDGFVEYERRSDEGLDNQGWKDSHDSIFMEDGTLVTGRIALCEVQGYVYQAKRAAAHLASVLDQNTTSERLLDEAETLKQDFQTHFWSDELETYVLALDGDKNPCHVPSSNAGHCLFSGIADDDRAEQIVETLFETSSYCGWGIRTLPRGEVRYNPMSYHNGSIWPHDNAMIAQGLARYGFKGKAIKLLSSFFDVSLFMEESRLPELFCGFRRRKGKGPTEYPVACLPQAWASGSAFMMLQACLGLSVDGQNRHICFDHPRLPDSLNDVHLRNLRVGDEHVDLHLQRYGSDVGVNITERSGPVKLTIEK